MIHLIFLSAKLVAPLTPPQKKNTWLVISVFYPLSGIGFDMLATFDTLKYYVQIEFKEPNRIL